MKPATIYTVIDKVFLMACMFPNPSHTISINVTVATVAVQKILYTTIIDIRDIILCTWDWKLHMPPIEC